MQHENWYLEGYFSGNALLSRLTINVFPFKIGREAGVDFVVPGTRASRNHAEFIKEGERLFLRDKNSTNGTFVNRTRIKEQTEVQHGDILHFADFEVRLIKESVKKSSNPTLMQSAIPGISTLSEKMPAGIRALQEMVEQKMIAPAFQPIVNAMSADIFGYEILGRGTHSELPVLPGPLFRIAESVDNLPMQLSQLFRDVGIATAATFDTKAAFFMNVHPDELRYARLLLLQMEKIRKDHPDMKLVLEIHEKAVPSLPDMKKICRELDVLRIKLAYDDFGAGQARFIELIEAPAHYLKFDISLVRHIDIAPPAKRSMVQSLVTLSKNMGILTLAEGLESEAEVKTCQDMGFDLIQGFYFGKPKIGSL
ncbi:MAG TPA: EAL domain-containing protein [Pseudomonadales bacterium]|nr:EAL domain-containing protein [Pseudomonadales bacterium]